MGTVEETSVQDHDDSFPELILHDVLNHIFGYLNAHDLSQAAKVCKSWNCAAEIEKRKRGPQVIVLQALEDCVATGFSSVRQIDKDELAEDFKLSLRIKPSIGLFFTDGKYPASADCDSVPYEICVAHQWTQPADCFYVAIESLGVYLNKNSIRGERNITVASFLPTLPEVNYIIVETSAHCIEQYFRRSDSLLTDISDKLFDTASDHVSLLIFVYHWRDEPTLKNYHDDFLSKILDRITNRYDSGTYSLWGGAVNDIFTMAPDTRPLYHSTSFCAISISGSRVKSWCIVLDFRLSDTEIEEKLKNFEESVILKFSSIAFAILPSNGTNDIDKTKINIFNEIFSSTPLTCVFNDRSHTIFATNSFNSDSDPELKHTHCYAILILTF
ncbi:hypothetical protein QAD02_015876 [Eretmocerus hayati]|uniref:Uncharacterized protein n=1 Tax=Eretmocerus hayati TaxID=131215 RepID=A0ACC2PBX2_9HYME|nr:hypothetical protein QAD02_015876 [Eretmocerus hayati]